ncbi:MAG: hypothetical protein R3E53_18540 [Myxococcota bacterium]
MPRKLATTFGIAVVMIAPSVDSLQVHGPRATATLRADLVAFVEHYTSSRPNFTRPTRPVACRAVDRSASRPIRREKKG